MSVAKFTYVAMDGKPRDGELTLGDYKVAADAGIATAQLINMKYPDADVARFGTAFEQGQQSVGIYTKANPKHGIRVSSMSDVLNGNVHSRRMAGEGLSSGGGVVAPSTQGTTPASRVFFPETVLQIMNEVLQEDHSLDAKAWASMLGSRENISTEMFTQPKIDVSAPRAEDSQPISQNSMPKTMVSVTTSQVAKAIATNSIGLQISDQAIQHASIDLVGTIFAQQTIGESLRSMWADIAAIKNGNLDTGDAALTPVPFTTYDAAAAAGTVTQKGWIKFLYDFERKVNIDSIICDLDTYLAIQGRLGRPVIFDPNTGTNAGNEGTYGLNVTPNLLNISVGVPNVLIVPTSVIGANTFMGFDSRFGIREVNNVSAAYSATETMILQRTNFFRVDWGRMAYRMFDEAFKVVDIS